MAKARTEGDVTLDFRGIDFSKMTEKGLPDPSEQPKLLKLLELFGGIGAPRRGLENIGYDIRSIDYVEVLPYAVMAYNQIFDCGPKAQDIRIWNMAPDVVVHGSPCFTGETLIQTTGGLKAIRDITTEDKIRLALNNEEKEYAVLNTWDNGVQDIYELTFSDGFKCKCTKNHRFLRYNMDVEISDSYIWATVEKMMEHPNNEAIAYLKTEGFTESDDMALINVQYMGKERVYDIEVDDAHAFLLKNGVVAHNCQDFSNEGKNNFNTGRSILFERTLQILDPNPPSGQPELSRQPKVVIWENVPRLLWSYKDCLDYYVSVMEEFGYVSYYDVLTASDYNIPQDRDRVFVVSILKDLPCADKFTFPEKMPQKWSLKQFIDTSVSFDDPAVQLTEKEKEILSFLPDGTLTVKEGTKKGYKEVEEWQIINLTIPGSKNRRGRVGDNAKTITTAPRQAIYYGGRVRMLSAKEYLRLMGYRDIDYKKMHDAGITDAQICTLAGNSICVPVLEAIFRRLAEIGVICKPEETKTAKQRKQGIA